MNLFFIYLLYQFNSIYISSKQTIYQLLYTTLNENLYLQHKQGTKLEILLSRIDQQTPFSWFNQNFLDMKPSSTRQILTKNPSLITYLPNNQMEAHLYSDIIMIGDNKLYFHFYVPISRKEDHSLTLAYQVEKEEFSFVHILKKQKLINKLIYSIFPNNPYEGNFYFGTPPTVPNKSTEGKCNIINDKWACSILSGKISDNFIYNTSSNANITLFQIKEKFVYVPKGFLEFIVRSLNTFNIRNKRCEVTSNARKEYYYIYCDDPLLIGNHSISFLIGEYEFTCPLSTYFSISSNSAMSNIMYHKRKCLEMTNNTKQECWIFGSDFILKYVSSFDYENNVITFISKDKLFPIKRIINTNEMSLQQMLIMNVIYVNIGIQCIVIIMLFYIKNQNNL